MGLFCESRGAICVDLSWRTCLVLHLGVESDLVIYVLGVRDFKVALFLSVTGKRYETMWFHLPLFIVSHLAKYFDQHFGTFARFPGNEWWRIIYLLSLVQFVSLQQLVLFLVLNVIHRCCLWDGNTSRSSCRKWTWRAGTRSAATSHFSRTISALYCCQAYCSLPYRQ